jgi:DNA-directed RNA polymerase subunit F
MSAAPPLAPAVALALSEQRAVLDYAERIANLTPERAEELLSPVTHEQESGHDAQDCVKSR